MSVFTLACALACAAYARLAASFRTKLAAAAAEKKRLADLTWLEKKREAEKEAKAKAAKAKKEMEELAAAEEKAEEAEASDSAESESTEG